MLVSALTGYRRELGRQQKRITLLLIPAVSVPARVPAKTMMELWHLAIRKIGTAMNRIVSRVPAKTMMELWHLAIRKIGTAMNRIVSIETLRRQQSENGAREATTTITVLTYQYSHSGARNNSDPVHNNCYFSLETRAPIEIDVII
ncbi:hypothetical protein QE152_g6346 [Popillia japonica]|uniref:Uncharacterized protein n=1 Tax=Popillia japonica TaxID=7064 RepID=A0AAW1MIE3_POPJA